MGEVAHAQCYNRSGWRLLIGGALAFMVVFRAVAGLIGMFRNMTAVVDPIAAVKNYLLPIWMIVFGVSLVRHPPTMPEVRSTALSMNAPFSG